MEGNSVSLEEIFKVLKNRWKLILLFVLSSILVASIVLFFLIDPLYEINTKVFIGKGEYHQEEYNVSDIQMYQKLLKTYTEIIKTEDLITKSIEKDHLKIETKEALNNLTVVSLADTQILELKYRSKSPDEAIKLISSLKDEFIKLSLELVPNGNIQVIEEARFPTNPISPNKKMGFLISIVLGLVLGFGTTLFVEFMDNTYKNKESLEKELDIPVLGTVPNLK